MVKARGKWVVLAAESANSALNWLPRNVSVWNNLQLCSDKTILKTEMIIQVIPGVLN